MIEPHIEEAGHVVEAEARLLGESDLWSVGIVLSEHVEHDFRPERLDDLLEKEASFLEVERMKGSSCLIAKDSLLWLRVAAPLQDLSETDLFATNRRIRVRLSDGTRITGHVLYDLGAADAPLCDFINKQGRYFEVVEAGMIYFVHKQFVSWIEEVSA